MDDSHELQVRLNQVPSDNNKRKKTMIIDNETFINETKKIVRGESNPRRAIRKLGGLGYKIANDKGGVVYLSHDYLGTRKISIAVREGGNPRWGLNFVCEVRHAMWNVAA
jgi:hypothetical protein